MRRDPAWRSISGAAGRCSITITSHLHRQVCAAGAIRNARSYIDLTKIVLRASIEAHMHALAICTPILFYWADDRDVDKISKPLGINVCKSP